MQADHCDLHVLMFRHERSDVHLRPLFGFAQLLAVKRFQRFTIAVVERHGKERRVVDQALGAQPTLEHRAKT